MVAALRDTIINYPDMLRQLSFKITIIVSGSNEIRNMRKVSRDGERNDYS